MLAAMTTGSKPDLSEQFKRDTVMAEAVRTAANALKASEPSFTALYDSIPQSRQITRDRMAKMLEIYQASKANKQTNASSIFLLDTQTENDLEYSIGLTEK